MLAYIFYVYDILIFLLTTLGLRRIYKKCGLNEKLVWIPLYRFYKLAEYLEMDEDGMTYLIAGIIFFLCRLGDNVTGRIPGDHYRTIILISVLLVIFLIVRTISYFSINLALVTCFGLREKHSFLWSLLWTVFPVLPAMIWGYSDKYQPQKKENEEGHTAAVSGVEAHRIAKGLTVNLVDRTVRSRMKKRCLLKDIHLNIEPGKMVLLLGGSGAGKTTFLNAVTGYEPANAKIFLDGEDVYKDFKRMKYRIGFVPQQDLIRYEDTVQNTLMDAASLRLPVECSREEKKKRVAEVLDIFGLTPVKNNIVAKQSGGQKKRISIAMEFVADPSLFILDEPDSGLDGILAREMMQRLHDISRQGKMVIVITHTPDRVIDLFDEVIVLGKDADRTGRLVFHGSIEKAREFFEVERMEQIIRKINCKDEGGEGLSDALIEKYAEVCHGAE